MRLNTLADHLPTPPNLLHYKVYLATLERTPVVVIDLHSNHEDQPRDLAIYSALYPLSLLTVLDLTQTHTTAYKEFKEVYDTFEEYLELYDMV